MAIEKGYNHFWAQRHGLFHVDEPAEASRIIEDREEAIRLINETLEIVENTYRELVKEKSGEALLYN